MRIFVSVNKTDMLKNKFLLSLIIFPAIAVAQPTGGGASNQDLQLNAITTSMPFLSINPDSRSGAMGDAGTALSPNSSSIYWNTAMLNFSEKDAEISVSYTPWLRQLTNDMHLSYVSAYKRLGKRQAIGGAFRYFSLGEITFRDNASNFISNFKPNEFEIVGAYAFKLSERTSVGINGKFANSNLTGGLVTAGATTKAAVTGAADISFVYRDDRVRLAKKKGIYTFAATINNVGNKTQYSSLQERDFLPTNLKIGNSYTMNIDQYNSFTLAVDLQKLLVPSPPIYNTNRTEILAGKATDVGVINGMLQSFYDAPGVLETDKDGKLIQNADGTYKVEKGSRLKEEIREINLGIGMEYWYNKMFALRGGYFHEHYTKGSRQYFTFGVGLKYNIFGVDISYLAALKYGNPLANTLRFTLRFDIGSDMNKNKGEEVPN